MVFPLISDFSHAPVWVPPADIPEGPFAVLTQERSQEDRLTALAVNYGPRLLVPEVWSRLLPQAGVLISSAISGGTLRQRFQEAADTYPRRCWLLVEPLAMDFSLPCPTGCGEPASIPSGCRQFYSQSLCCYYAHFFKNEQGHMVLWDTQATLETKLALAKECGFLGYVFPAGSIDNSKKL